VDIQNFAMAVVPAIILIYAILQIVGATRNLEGPIFWVGRQVMILAWKRKKMWPIEVKYIGKSARAVWRPAQNRLQLDVELVIKVKKRSAQSKIDGVRTELTSDGQTWSADEDVPVDSCLRLTELRDKKLAELADGKYTTVFSLSIDDELKKWYNRDTIADMHGIVKIEAEGLDCQANLGIIER
jgi:hypothetical protein